MATTKDRIKVILDTLISDVPADQADDGRDLLTDLKHLIQAANRLELTTLLEEVDIGPIFNVLSDAYLQTQDRRSTDEIIEIFGILVGGLPPEFVAVKFEREISVGLNSGREQINLIWLKAISRILDDDFSVTNFVNSPAHLDILSQIVDLLGRESTLVAKHCHDVLVKVAKNSLLQDLLFGNEFANRFNNVKSISDVVSLRVLTLSVCIANISPILMDKVKGFMTEIQEEELVNDPLLALNYVQLMTDLTTTDHGIQYLTSSGALKHVGDQIISGDLILGDILLPGYFTLFGAVGHSKPNVLRTDYGHVVERIIESLGSHSNATILGAAIDVIGILGQKIEGKKMLNTFNKLEGSLHTLGKIIAELGSDLKTRALVTLAHLLEVEESDPNGEATILAEEWFEKLLPKKHEMCKVLIAVSKQPFLETRLAAMNVVRVMATHLWGQKELAQIHRFADYMTDRNTEFDKLGKEAKYAIVRELTISPFTTVSFDAETRLRFRKFLKEGPYYVETESAVAVEGQM